MLNPIERAGIEFAADTMPRHNQIKYCLDVGK